LTFNLDVAPERASVAVTVDSHGIVDTQGTVLVSGTMTCTGAASSAFLNIYLRQQADDLLTVTETHNTVACTPTGERWVIYAAADDGAFRPGPATVRVAVNGFDGFSSYSSSSGKRSVSLDPIEAGATPFEPTGDFEF